MKVLIVACAVFAAASAGFVGPAAYHGVHVPVLDQNGYQIDTADVAQAKAAHFAAYAEANARLAGHALVAPLNVAAPLAYAGPQHIPVIGPNGVPVDTPEVAAGKAANAAAHIEAKARNGDVAVIAPVTAYAHGYAAAPVAIANGVPVDTAEVAHAKAAHFAAHVEAKVRNGDFHAYAHPLVHYRKRRGVFGAAYAAPVALAHAYPHHIPVIGANGVPLDTPEVVAAKASHAAAHVAAAASSGAVATLAPVGYSAGIAAHSVIAPIAYAGPQHIPVIGPNGVPLDTPEVAAGKVANAVAHAEAQARNGYVAPLSYAAAHGVVASVAYAGPQHIPVIGANGVPVDTPEVAAGKVANAVAHAEAKARNGDLAVVAPLSYAAGHGVLSPLSYAATHGVVAPVAYAHAHYAGPQHIPVIGPNGVPLDTPEVAAGKAANVAAHLEAKVRNGDLVHHY